MNVLFLGYWGLHDGLTSATILPHLEVLSKIEEVNSIVFCSIERGSFSDTEKPILPQKVVHQPLFSQNFKINIFNKFNDFISFPQKIVEMCQHHQIDHIIARGSPAGALAYLSWKKIKIPFSVESFEPHAAYMLESGVWKKWDPRYLFQKHWEERQKEFAHALMPVSENYETQLITEGIAKERIDMIPCCVNLENFQFSYEHRRKIRDKYDIGENTIVGIYVGKFGGIYYDGYAFELFYSILHKMEKYYLFILSPDDPVNISMKLQSVGFSENCFQVLKVAHEKVREYLSASDIAFATIKPSPSRLFCSPIKTGEYWANGLPVVITKGVGDDSEIIEKNKIGWVFPPVKNINRSDINKIPRDVPVDIARQFRGFHHAERVYKKRYGN